MRAESGDGILGDGADSALPTSKEVWGSAASSPSAGSGAEPRPLNDFSQF